MGWSPDRVKILTELWAQGQSASQIAAKLGDVSRNAVIGKVHRLGLSGENRGAAGAELAKAVSAKTDARAEANGHGQDGHGQDGHGQADKKAFGEAIENPEGARGSSAISRVRRKIIKKTRKSSILALDESTCKFPIGDPGTAEFHFCGGPVGAGAPYCEHHRQIAYQPSADRRKARRTAAIA